MKVPRKALVVGANGLFGERLSDRLEGMRGWTPIRLSRAPGPHRDSLAADLTKPEAIPVVAAALAGVTHIFYAARLASSLPDAERDVNAAMLHTLLAAVDVGGGDVRHIQLMHGTKWYGSHLGPYPTPAREEGPRAADPCYYHLQQDLLSERGAGSPWTWCALRPHTVCGVSAGRQYSLVPLIGAYAALCREMDAPFDFPGTQACYDSVSQATDIDLLVDAAIWAATTPECAGEAFNVVNADYFRWRDLWPRIAEWFGLAPGVVRPRRMAREAAALAPAWARMARRHGLRTARIEQVGDWGYLDRILRSEHDDMSSTVKIRRYGFGPVVETEEMFRRLFDEMRRDRLIG
jgi:nucleoside-diphosphate-sugar epimerase